MELRTMSFIETTEVACSDFISHNRVQVLSIPVLLLTCSEDWTCNLQMIVSLEAQKENLNMSTGKKSYIIVVIIAKVRTLSL